MNPSLYFAFVIAAAVLIIVPGPTAMLVTSTSLRRGVRAGLSAVAGSTCAVAIQLTVVVTGVASILTLIGNSFEWIRWAGVAYLVYLGLRAWFNPTVDGTNESESQSSSLVIRDFARGFVVTLTNPKTLLFLGAFLPQFVDPSMPVTSQLLILAISFLSIAAFLDSGWAVLGARVGKALTSVRAKRLVDLVSGSILVGAGATLAMFRQAE